MLWKYKALRESVTIIILTAGATRTLKWNILKFEKSASVKWSISDFTLQKFYKICKYEIT